MFSQNQTLFSLNRCTVSGSFQLVRRHCFADALRMEQLRVASASPSEFRPSDSHCVIECTILSIIEECRLHFRSKTPTDAASADRVPHDECPPGIRPCHRTRWATDRVARKRPTYPSRANGSVSTKNKYYQSHQHFFQFNCLPTVLNTSLRISGFKIPKIRGRNVEQLITCTCRTSAGCASCVYRMYSRNVASTSLGKCSKDRPCISNMGTSPSLTAPITIRTSDTMKNMRIASLKFSKSAFGSRKRNSNRLRRSPLVGVGIGIMSAIVVT